MIARTLQLTAALALLAMGGGCDGADKKARSDAAPTESAKPRTKLEQALEAAAAASATASASAEQGPPPAGVFAPGAAEREQPAGAPAKVTMIKSGDGPKVALGTAGLATGTAFSVTVSSSAFQGPMPAMRYLVEVADAKDKGKDKEKKGKADASASAEGAPGAVAESRPLVFRVKEAKLDPRWPGKLPAGADAVLAKLAGVRIQATLTPRGGLTGMRLEVAKEVAAELSILAGGLTDALETVFVPVPSEPVAVGASWLVSDRGRFAGLDVVRYRAVTLQKVEGDAAVLAVDVRQYAASPDSVPEGLPPGAQALQVESFGRATVARKVGEIGLLDAKVGIPLDLVIGKGATPAGKVRAEVKAEIVVGSAAAPAKK